MKTFILQTISYSNQDIKGTRGQLLDSNLNHLCPTLELPFISEEASKAVGKSCIPEGTYKVVKDDHGKYQWWKITHILNERVNTWEDMSRETGRTAIELHPANYLSDLKGCIALGTSAGIKDSNLTIWNSKSMFDKLKDTLGKEFSLIVKRSFL